MKYLAFSSISQQTLLNGLSVLLKYAHVKSVGSFDFYDMASALDQWFIDQKIPLKTHTFLALLFDDMAKSDSVVKKVKSEDLVKLLGMLPDRLQENIPDIFIEKYVPTKFWEKLRPKEWVSSHA